MKFLEKDLEDIIWEADYGWIRDRGLPIYDNALRQVRIGKYGIADIISWKRYQKTETTNGFLDIRIYELKRGIVDSKALSQSIRYAVGVRKYIHDIRWKFMMPIRMSLICIGESFADDDLFYMCEFNQYSQSDMSFDFFRYSYNWDGILFKRYFHENPKVTVDYGLGDSFNTELWSNITYKEGVKNE